jgi:hypothetical protein
MAHLWKRGSFKRLKVGGKLDKAERRVVLRGADKGATISKAEWIKRVQGAHPTKLAAERKAGLRGYKFGAAGEARLFHGDLLRWTRWSAHSAQDRRSCLL